MEEAIAIIKGVTAMLDAMSNKDDSFVWDKDGILLLETNLINAVELLEKNKKN